MSYVYFQKNCKVGKAISTWHTWEIFYILTISEVGKVTFQRKAPGIGGFLFFATVTLFLHVCSREQNLAPQILLEVTEIQLN